MACHGIRQLDAKQKQKKALRVFLLNKWGMPDSIVEAALYHIQPDELNSGSDSYLTALVHASSHYAEELMHKKMHMPPMTILNKDWLQSADILKDRLQGWRFMVERNISDNTL